MPLRHIVAAHSLNSNELMNHSTASQLSLAFISNIFNLETSSSSVNVPMYAKSSLLSFKAGYILSSKSLI